MAGCPCAGVLLVIIFFITGGNAEYVPLLRRLIFIGREIRAPSHRPGGEFLMFLPTRLYIGSADFCLAFSTNAS
jgi:hypothetical protein